MYGLASDRHEMKNMADHPASGGIKTKLAGMANSWWRETGGGFLHGGGRFVILAIPIIHISIFRFLTNVLSRYLRLVDPRID